MAGAQFDYRVDDEGVYSTTFTLFYPYSRTVGPTIGRFLTGLRERRIEGVRAADGRVLVPPPDFDPHSGQASTEWVAVADEGTIVTWSWVPEPVEGQPLDHPFAWALIKLDGADTNLLHAVDVASPSAIASGARVKARWADEPIGAITDIACFEVTA